MKFVDFKFIYISLDYLRYMHKVDPEIFFVDNPEYEKKPHLGLLINEADKKYVIPLTSAKTKHATWDDVTANTYRIYEIIDTRTAVMDPYDIIVDIKNKDLLKQKNIPSTEYSYYKQRILSVLDIRKMFPITEGAYRLAELDLVTGLALAEQQRRGLMQKEYEFCVKIKDDIRRKASQVYDKQVQTGKVLKFHCNFKVLEQAADTYEVMTIW